MRTFFIASFVAALAAAAPLMLLIYPTQAAAAAASAATIKIDNFVFGPATLVVKAGTTVTWTNNDDIPHTVVFSDHASFKSKVLDTDQSFSFTFTVPGEYPYFCSLHPHMTGKVVVQG